MQSLPLANSYAAITYKRVTGSFVAGVAYLGKVCASKRERVNINLYHGDAIDVAEVRSTGGQGEGAPRFGG